MNGRQGEPRRAVGSKASASTTLADSFELSLNAGSAMRASIGRRARQGENDEFSNGWERRLRRA